jgi:pimeloyl-ACP methyl ester carboxylesterase
MRRNTKKQIFIIGTIIASCITVIVVGTSYYALRKLTYAGDRIVYGKKLSALTQEIRSELLKRPDAREVTITTDDNLRLSGLLFKRPHAQANLLICHGYKSAKEMSYTFIDLFPNWNILLFDFRAHGLSEGSVTSIGCNEYKDIVAAAKFLREQTNEYNNIPFILLGLSMGGAASIKAAALEPHLCDTLIVDSSYSSLETTMYKAFAVRSGLPTYPFFPVIKMMFLYVADCDIHTMCPAEYVKTIKQPILFIHSCNDDYVSPKNAVRLYANALNPLSKIWIAPHCRHAWLHAYRKDSYKHKILKFVKKVCPSFVA